MANSKSEFCVSYEQVKEWIMNDDEEEMKKCGFEDDEDFIEGEYEYLGHNRVYLNRVKFYIPIIYNGEEAEYSKVIQFNTSSPFALWMSGLDEEEEDRRRVRTIMANK
jgi:hypothetical protein